MGKIGFVGLGNMGLGMASNLVKKSGQPILGYDVVEVLRDRFAAAGGTLARDGEEIYRDCDVIFLSLPTNEIVKAEIGKILETAKAGTIVVDTSSSSPYIIRELHQKALDKGLFLLDAPVSGGQQGANEGTLVIMVGGDREAFDKVKPYLEMMGKTATHMGPSGCGDLAKIANNMMVGIHLSAMGEAFAFATKAGLDPAVLFQAIHGGFAQSAVMVDKVPKILNRDFEPGARIAVHLKDIDNALEAAAHLGLDLPGTKLVKDQMTWIKEQGLIDQDQAAMVKYYESSMAAEVKAFQE